MMTQADRKDLTVLVGDTTPAEACANCGVFRASNRRLSVVEVDDLDVAVASAAICEVCAEHYGPDGVAVRLWPDICDWIPLRIFEDCQCETCTGQIEFRITAGTDFYD